MSNYKTIKPSRTIQGQFIEQFQGIDTSPNTFYSNVDFTNKKSKS